MSNLGRYLEALFSAGDCMPSAVEATITHWVDEHAQDAAASRKVPHGRKRIRPDEGDGTGTIAATIHAQLQLPDKARITTCRFSKERSGEMLIVANADKWSVDSGNGSVRRGEGGFRKCRQTTDVERHFDGELIRQIIVGLQLEDGGPISFHDSECVRIYAVQRPGSQIWPHWLPHAAERYELIGEIATGYLLSIAGILNDKTYEKYEITQLERNVVLDEALFQIEPKPTNVIDDVPRMQPVASPAIAKSRVDFEVFVPTFLPEHELVQLIVMVDRESSDDKFSVSMHYHGASSFKMLLIRQGVTPDHDESDYEWEDVDLNDLSMKISDPGNAGMRFISQVKNGTHVVITTDLDRATALQVASSLAPA